jgi:hypothetical protein
LLYFLLAFVAVVPIDDLLYLVVRPDSLGILFS